MATTASTDVLIDVFGSQTIVSESSTPSLGSSAIASSAAVVDWTNSDDAPEAALVFKGTYNTAPAGGGTVFVYARAMGIGADSTDSTIPSTTFKSDLIAAFPVDQSTAVQVIGRIVGLPNMEASQTYQFYPENQASQTLSSNYTLHVRPKTQGPSTG